jgi:hypothetical protein
MKSRWTLLAGPLVALTTIVGQWASARRAENAIRDEADAWLARTAVAYLSVVTPAGTASGYDPARLLSGVNSLATASFWPGGLQVTLGAVPLLPDTVGLIPVPDSLIQELDHNAGPVVARHARTRVTLVPFLDRDRWGMLGWAATWGAVRPRLPTGSALLLSALAGVAVIAAGVVLLRRAQPRWRLGAIAGTVACLALLASDLDWSVRQTARAATETRLLTLKRLIEVAATAPGVRQTMLPEIAVGVLVRPFSGTATSGRDMVRQETDSGPVLSVAAATPRTQGGLELSVRPVETSLRELRRLLAGWVTLAVLALCLAAGPGRR